MQNITGNLNEILKVIADTLGLSVEFVKQNGTKYLLEFGKYKYFSSILSDLAWGLFLSFAMIFILIAIYDIIDALFYDFGKILFKNKKTLITIISIILFFTFLSPLIADTVKYISSPTIYSIQEAYEMVK